MRVGVTGGICTGKSAVLKYLEEKGYLVLSADSLAHELMKKGGRNYQGIIAYFDDDILDESGEIDRKKLGGIVFSDLDLRMKLEEITHQGIMEELIERSKGTPLSFLEIPLLFEGGFEEWVDTVWVVDCLPATQLQRMQARDQISTVEGRQRLEAQLSRDERIKRGYPIVSTEGGYQAMELQIDKLLEELLDD